MIQKAYAKVNWHLNIINKREDNYHELEMLMQRISIYDVIDIKLTNAAFEIDCNIEELKNVKKNLIYKIWIEIKEKYSLKQNIIVKLEKKIPIGAGLGGGSSDAATSLNLINELFKLNMTYKEKKEIGTKVGMDIPFFFGSGVQIATNRGENLKKVGYSNTGKFFVVVPKILVSTPKVYNNLEPKDYAKQYDYLKVVKNFLDKDFLSLQDNSINHLEKPAFRLFPYIETIKKQIENEIECIYCRMSGSGPSLIVLAKNFEIARAKLSKLNNCDIFIVEGVN